MASDKKLDSLIALYQKECEQEAKHTAMKESIWNKIQELLAEDEYIRPVDAAKMLGVSGTTVTNWIRAGVFRPEEYKKVSSHTYVISKSVVKRADFFERRKELGRPSNRSL